MITWTSISEKGEREHNEDFVGVRQVGERYCFVLADGLGGHGKGEVASQLVVTSILEDFEQSYDRDCFLQQSLMHAQKKLCEEQRKRNCPEQMKTTVVCLLVDHNYVQWAYAGDSRLYLFYKKKIKSRTLDHSVPQMLVLSKEMKEKAIRFHEDRNRLLKVMGIESDKQVFDVSKPMERKENQRFLLCSDGFWEFVLEKNMEKSMKKAETPKEWMDALSQIAVKNGAGKNMDNYSAIAVWL